MNQAIPSFYLYGEAPRDVEDHFLHLEDLAERSRPADWNIRAHAHANLNHVFFLTHGAGEMVAEGEPVAFQAPCLLLIPAGLVHAFGFEPESAGKVLTVAEDLLRELIAREPLFGRIFAAASTVGLNPAETRSAAHAVASLARELSWNAVGRMAAVEAHLVALLVIALRAAEQAREPSRAIPGPRAVLVARFREALERRFRASPRIEAYCEELGATPSQLRAACLAIAGKPPLGLVQERLMLEAKRSLLYSNMTVAEIAYDLGFDDPAYFSRFFSAHAGRSPRAFRAR